MALDSLFTSQAAKTQIVFEERAKQMAARVRKDMKSDTLSVTIFQIGRERYGLPSLDLAEIVPFAECTPVPGSPVELRGVISVHSQLRCVIDLAALLGLNPDPSDEQRGYILLLRNKSYPVGLKVSHVHQVEKIERATLENQDLNNSNLLGTYVRGITPSGLILLNLDSVLAHPIFRTVD